jgi:hypothetical protein
VPADETSFIITVLTFRFTMTGYVASNLLIEAAPGKNWIDSASCKDLTLREEQSM